MAARLKPIDTLHIPEARFIREDGTAQFVQPALPGEYLRPGRVAYDKMAHHKKLICPQCNVRVDFNKGSGIESCGANIRGSRPHFKKAPGQEHEKDCELPLLQNLDSDSRIDKNEGFRIHLNRDFGAASDGRGPIYMRAAGGKVYSHDQRLQPKIRTVVTEDGPQKLKFYRESVVAKGAKDFIDLMRRGEHERLKDSLVVNNTVVTWDNFAILKSDRMLDLVHRLKNGASHPVLLKVALHKEVNSHCAEAARVFLEQKNGENQFVVPRVYLDGPGTGDAFPDKGNYLVLGLPRLKFNAQSGVHFLNISLKDMAHVEPYFLGPILEDAKVNQQRREQRKLALT